MTQDLYNNIRCVQLKVTENSQASVWTKYIDTAGYDAITFLIETTSVTADGSNYFTPTLQVASSTPTSTASYSASTDYLGSITVPTTATTTLNQIGYTGITRYLALKFTETGIADSDIRVYAILGGGLHGPISSDSPTTGTVS